MIQAIHDLSVYEPSIFVPAFTELLPSVLDNLLAPTLSLRAQACHALGGFALGTSRIPSSVLHTRISESIVSFLTVVPITPPKASSSTANVDPPIVRTLRTTLNAQEPQFVAHGPVWALSVLASFIVLLGPALCVSVKLTRVLSALFTLAMRHKKSSVRALTCLVWRSIVWVYFRPPLRSLTDDCGPSDMDDETQDPRLTTEEEERRANFWRVVKSIVDMGTGIATAGSLLGARPGEDCNVTKVITILKSMAQKGGFPCHDAMEVIKRLVGSEEAPDWDWNKLLPPALFSSSPGLLTADFRMLSEAVKPIFDQTALTTDIRPLTGTELRAEGVFDGLTATWRLALTQVNLSTDAQLPVRPCNR